MRKTDLEAIRKNYRLMYELKKIISRFAPHNIGFVMDEQHRLKKDIVKLEDAIAEALKEHLVKGK